MKYLILTILIFFVLVNCKKDDRNSILLSDELTYIRNQVDVLTDSYISDKSYRSTDQGICSVFYFKGNSIDSVRADVENKMTMDQLIFKYPEGRIFHNQLMTFESVSDTVYGAYSRARIVSIDMIAGSIHYQDSVLHKTEIGELIQNVPKSKSDESSIWALKVHELKLSQEIPMPYQEWIHYHYAILGDKPILSESSENSTPYLNEVNIDTLDIEAKRNLLNYAMNNKVVSFCGSDDRSLKQEILKYRLSVATNNYPVFIRSVLNVISDNVARASDDDYSRNKRSNSNSNFNLTNLNIDPKKFYLGGYLSHHEDKNDEIVLTSSFIGRMLKVDSKKEVTEECLNHAIDSNLDWQNRIKMLFIGAKLVSDLGLTEKELKEKIGSVIDTFPVGFKSKLEKKLFGK